MSQIGQLYIFMLIQGVGGHLCFLNATGQNCAHPLKIVTLRAIQAYVNHQKESVGCTASPYTMHEQ